MINLLGDADSGALSQLATVAAFGAPSRVEGVPSVLSAIFNAIIPSACVSSFIAIQSAIIIVIKAVVYVLAVFS